MAWKNVSKGVRYREHESRKHNRRPDRYYMLTYKRDGKTVNEALGWASDGFTQADAEDLMETLRKNWRSGTGVQSLREMREHEADKRDQSVAARKEQERQDIPLADYWATAYLPHAQRTKKDASWGKEEQHFRVWLDPNFGSLPLTKFGMPQWDALMRTLHKAGLSQRSREYIFGTLRRILRHAQDRGLPVVVPTGKQIGATAPRNNRRQRVLTPGEKEQLLSALAERDVNAWRVAQFAMLTGCRLSEALRLRWAHVDLVAASVRFVDTKNKDSRSVPLAQPLMEMLKGVRGKAFNPDAPVFTNSLGKAWTAVPEAFKVVIRALGFNDGRGPLDRASFHTLRHTVATELAGDLDIRSLMDFMGWRHVAMAARYIHANKEAQIAAVNLLERRLRPSEGKLLEFRKDRVS